MNAALLASHSSAVTRLLSTLTRPPSDTNNHATPTSSLKKPHGNASSTKTRKQVPPKFQLKAERHAACAAKKAKERKKDSGELRGRRMGGKAEPGTALYVRGGGVIVHHC